MILISERFQFIYIELPGSESIPMLEYLSCIDPDLKDDCGQRIQKRCFPLMPHWRRSTREWPFESFGIVRNPYEMMVYLYESTRSALPFEEFVQRHEPKEYPLQHVIRYEHFLHDMKQISARFKLPYSCRMFQGPPSVPNFSEYYNETIREIVYEKFKQDIERFHFRFPTDIIPNVVYQAYDILTDNVSVAHEEIKQLNYDMQFELFNLQACEDYLQENFDKIVVETFRLLRFATMKIQFWSYCILYKKGGIYLDPHWIPQIRLHNCLHEESFVVHQLDELHSSSPFDDMERLKDPVHRSYDMENHIWDGEIALYPGFMVAQAGNRTLRRCIYRIIETTKLYERVPHVEYVTGAGMLGDCYAAERQKKPFEFFLSRTDQHIISSTMILFTRIEPIKKEDALVNAWKNNTLFRRQNLLVTGGCGFIGSNFINYIFPKNRYNIYNIDAMYYCAKEENILPEIRRSPYYHLIRGNICSMELLEFILKNNFIDEVIHFAAQSHVQTSFDDSLVYTKDNVLGTHTLLESCRKYGNVKRIIHVSTDEVYGESMNDINETKKTEQSILCPTNPYAATKAGAELIAQSYQHSYKMPIIITRGNNVYGENQYPEKLIPKFIQQLKQNKRVTIQGDGTSVRAFMHALDAAKAFEKILCLGKVGEIYNIGTEEELSVMEVAKILIESIQETKDVDDWIEFVEDRPFNDQRYYISNNKLKELGWKPEIDFMTGLKQLL